MNPKIEELLHGIRTMEAELEVQMALARAELHVRIEDGKIEFDKAVLKRHREMKTRLLRYIVGARPLIALTAPLIYLLIVPFVLLDVFVTIYQAVCFPVYGIPKVKRRDYMVFDRRYLAYLNVLEKLNCAYCSYGNGLIGYVREIASRTEQFWCPIKHARKLVGAHPHYREFVEFGDAEAYREEVAKVAERLCEQGKP
ncbi:hypothetical protein [Thermomonas sp.]|uniref:hypothetical protein n=1 Tax=Thermomonas sp. TaxID=1971895 RepID=UPI002489776E|nr:hypothetical protein [Thermomonas sp.]MDI1253055.1 hypothetical protein [Thermomonas sp.]